ncbi:hypothetical protein PMI22_04364 [Pseudomonas sp. GM21]|jgi:hypothetical protein|nr:hypothetical protein PMI22_04364 [Pseudomonas sp. GM21]
MMLGTNNVRYPKTARQGLRLASIKRAQACGLAVVIPIY